jgi:hypothetical protein
LRRKATSGLSCSLACAVFFNGHGVAIEKPPDRAGCELNPMLAAQQLGNLNQADVDLGVDRVEDNVVIGLDPR